MTMSPDPLRADGTDEDRPYYDWPCSCHAGGLPDGPSRTLPAWSGWLAVAAVFLIVAAALVVRLVR